MRKDHFLSLKALLKGMRTEEIKVARRFVVSFDSNVTARANKSLMVLNLLVDKPDTTREKAKKKLGAGQNDSSFDRLLKRLKEKVLESLLLSVNIDRKDAYSDLFMHKYRVRKQLMELNILTGRGIVSEGDQIVSKIVSTCKKYELFDELVEVLQYESFRQVMKRKDPEETEQTERELNFYKGSRDAVVKALRWYYRYFGEVERTGLNRKNMALLMEAINDLTSEYKATKSFNVLYFALLLVSEYYNIIGGYKRSIAVGLRMAEIIQNNPAIYLDRRVGSAYMVVVEQEIGIFDFEQAIEHAQLSKQYFKSVNYNYTLSMEWELKALYYCGKATESFMVVNELLRLTNANHFPFHFSRRNYFNACILFVLRDFKKCNFVLHDTRELDKDREGWNIGIRVLSILSHIEQEQYDNADAQIESLRKHISRVKKEHDVRPRDIIIHRVLQQLEKNSYDFGATITKSAADLKQLATAEKGYSWEVNIPEMVVFHHWVQDKANGVPYTFRVPDEVRTAPPSSEFQEFEVKDGLEIELLDQA